MTAVDPHRLIKALEAAGWTRAEHRTGMYARTARPEHAYRQASLIVPLNETFADYEHLLSAVLQELADAARLGVAAQTVLDQIGEHHDHR